MTDFLPTTTATFVPPGTPAQPVSAGAVLAFYLAGMVLIPLALGLLFKRKRLREKYPTKLGIVWGAILSGLKIQFIIAFWPVALILWLRKRSTQCWYCGQYGHKRFTCPENLRCHHCGEQDHYSAYCPKRRAHRKQVQQRI